MALQQFRQLDAWQQAHALVLSVYRVTERLGYDERYGLVPQMRRSAVSVPANIVEGFKRRTALEKCRFYNIAEGSLEELRYYLLLCRDLGYQMESALDDQAERVAQLLSGLVRGLKT
jgi:four helix bundle protein